MDDPNKVFTGCDTQTYGQVFNNTQTASKVGVDHVCTVESEGFDIFSDKPHDTEKENNIQVLDSDLESELVTKGKDKVIKEMDIQVKNIKNSEVNPINE